MTRIQFPPVAPLPEGTVRPFWSVMIPTYNRTTYLERTLRSVLEQAPGPEEMQIEVVDNASNTDEVEKLVRKVGGSRINIYRQERNVGMIANWNKCVEQSKGKWVHILHDDDIVLPHFYETYERLICSYPNATLITGPALEIDERDQTFRYPQNPLVAVEGIIKDFTTRQATGNLLLCPTVVVSRETYQKAGGFLKDMAYTADWEMWSRVSLYGDVVTTVEPSAMYRWHQNSGTATLTSTGRNILDCIQAVNICYDRLPKHVQKEFQKIKYDGVAGIASFFAEKTATQGERKTSIIQATWALRLKPNQRHLRQWLKCLLGAM